MNTGPQILQQLQQELQNELTTSNQLLRQISYELNQIKEFTRPGGTFEANIKKNASLISKLANMQGTDIKDLPHLATLLRAGNNDGNQNIPQEQQEPLRENSNMESP